MDPIVYKNLSILRNYMCLAQQLPLAACIIGFGCINDEIAIRCAQLYRDGFAPKVVFSAGTGRNTPGRWARSEAERFADIAMAHGVPATVRHFPKTSVGSNDNSCNL